VDNLDELNETEKVVYRWRGHRRQPLSSDTPPDVLIRRELQNPVRATYNPRNVECLMAVLERTKGLEVNSLDKKTGEAPLHSLVKRERRDRVGVVLALLVHSDADIHLKTWRGATPLHLAVETGDAFLVKTLLAFGANINEQGLNDFTPLDLAIHCQCSEVETVLLEHGAKGSAKLIVLQQQPSVVPHLYSFDQSLSRPCHGQRLKTCDRLQEYIQRRGTAKLYQELENYVNQRLSLSLSLGRNGADELMAIAHQQKEMQHFNKTLKKKSPRDNPILAGLEGGSRLLFLDGGGMKGLSQIEALIQLEEATGRKTTELFDWIVGTSTGGIIALALVYAKLPLSRVRQLYFRLKNKVFANARFGVVYSAQELEKILREVFGDMTMDQVLQPKVLVAAVDKSTTNPELRFFNNCFGDGFDEELVWKVGRYTSASPIFFGEFENYVDGGVLANNPCDCGLTAIQNFYRLQGERLLISMVISIGTGQYPPEELGKVDAQEFLFFGKHWFKLGRLMDRATNLISLLSNALVNSELVAKNCKSRCEELGIPYFRLSPKLNTVVAAGETDNEKLVDMILQTKLQVKDQGLNDIVQTLILTAEYSRRILASGGGTPSCSTITESSQD
jgi:predicted acylesterase/phospholipase RssA